MSVNLNGDMSQWTWNTTFAACADKQMTANGFRYHKIGTAVHTVRRSTDVPSIDICGRIIPYSMEVEVTTADATVGATEWTGIVYRGEGSEWADLVDDRVRVRFWLKGVAGTYHLHLSNGAETLSYTQPIVLDVTDTWRRFDVFFPRAPGFEDGDWWTDHRVGYSLTLVLAAGANFVMEAEKWNPHSTSGFGFVGGGQINFNATVGNKIKIAGLRVGDGPLMYQPPELVEQACMRYIEHSFERGWSPAQGVGGGTGEHYWHATLAGALTQTSPRIRFVVPKRRVGAVTITGYNPVSANAQARSPSGDCNTTTFSQVTVFGFKVSANSPAGTTVGQELNLHWLADSSLPAMTTNIGG